MPSLHHGCPLAGGSGRAEKAALMAGRDPERSS